MDSENYQYDILVADDTPENLTVLKEILTKSGYTVRPILSGEGALKAISRKLPDLILLDIMMPKMNGFEVCRRLKADDLTRDIPVIFVSALNETFNKMEAFSVGGVDYIIKPFQEEELLARIRTHLALRHSNIRLTQMLTERDSLLNCLKESQKAAEAASLAKSEFLANMSHEIRTPMNSVLGFLELTLDDENLSEFQRKNLSIAFNSAKSLLVLLNDILDVSKLERGRLELEERPFDLHHLIRETLRTFEVKAKEKRLDLSFNLHSGLSSYYTGDPERLRQIFTNLIGNAIKFTERGGIILSAEPSDGGQKVLFTVDDTGIGIPPDRLDKIFEPFTQADSSTSRRYGGTGLGTSISKQLTQLMGGEIWVESEPGIGSAFHFTVRLKPAEAFPETESECTEFHPCRCFKIMLAEDIEENIMLAKIRLEQHGHTVIPARNGFEAIAAYEREHPDIILMDIHMPEMDGIQASLRIRKLEGDSGKHVPIIALTASIMKEEQQICLQAGMDAVVGKPIDFEELFQTVDKLVPEDRGRRIGNGEQGTENRGRKANDLGQGTEAVPVIEGVDTQKGLQTWQNAKAYKKALTVFSNDYEKTADNILNCIQNGDRENAYRITHAIKGVAGNLSITNVFRIAAKLNAELKEKPVDELILVIESLAMALKNVILSVKQMEIEDGEYASESAIVKQARLDMPALKKLFQETLASFNEYNPEAVEPFLEQLCRVLSPQQMEPIQRRLDSFDFDRAKEELTKLGMEMGIHFLD